MRYSTFQALRRIREWPSLLPRLIGAMQSVYRFDFVVKHCTRLQNALADCGTRHASMQDFRPHLGFEGFSDAVCAATPVRCRWSSPLSGSQRSIKYLIVYQTHVRDTRTTLPKMPGHAQKQVF